jgi:hypothetical protein
MEPTPVFSEAPRMGTFPPHPAPAPATPVLSFPATAAGSLPQADVGNARGRVDSEPPATASKPPLPPQPVRDTGSLGGWLTGGASGAGAALFATLLGVLTLAIPAAGRRLRPAADICRPPGFVTPIDVPG